MLPVVEQQQHGCAGKRDGRRLQMQRSRKYESDEHRADHGHGLAQQHRIGDHSRRIHAHDQRAALRRGVELAAPDHMNHQQLRRQDEHDDRRQIENKCIEIESGRRADQNVGWVADQRCRAADIAGENFGEQKWKRRKIQLLGNDERHRRDQEHRADIVEQRRNQRRGQLQHDEDAGRTGVGLLRRPDGEILKQAGAARNRDQDHHAGEQPDRVPIDAGDRLVLIERADSDGDRGADQRHHRAIEPAGNDQRVGEREDRRGDPHRIEAENNVRHEWIGHRLAMGVIAAPAPGRRNVGRRSLSRQGKPVG